MPTRAYRHVRRVAVDVGDVLLSTHPMRHYAAIGALVDLSSGQVRQILDDTEIIRSFEQGYIDLPDFLRELRSLLGMPTSVCEDQFEELWCTVIGEINLTLIPRISQLSDSGQLILASNTNEIHWRSIKQRLAEHGVEAPAWLSFEVHELKPGLGFFRGLLNKAACSPTDLLFIDDSRENVEAARAIGMHGLVHTDAATTDAVLGNVEAPC